MSLWLRVRRTRANAAVALAVAVALLPLGDLYLALPNLFGGAGLAVPLPLLVPLATAVAVAWGLTTGDPVLEAVASRPIHVLDATYALSVSVATVAACAIIGKLGGSEIAVAAGRNALGYIGLMLVGRRLLGTHAAPLLPVAFAITASLFGFYPDRQPRPWAWPLAPAQDGASWSVAGLCLIVGAAATLARSDAAAANG